jgi:formylglycine-generating enzyme required for sulfatase activity
VCVDKYEASVWSIPTESPDLVGRVRRGRATVDHLAAGGAQQMGAIPTGNCSGFEYGAGFPVSGNWTTPLYAASVAGVPPSTCITWFQAEQACRLSGKRLVLNADWQAAAAGTPDPGADDDGETTCATNSTFAALTGARSACHSSWGTYDMAGNVWEWVSGWMNAATACTSWDSAHGGDMSCVGFSLEGTPPPNPALVAREVVGFDPQLPGGVIRGGNYATGARNGIFAVFAGVNPSNVSRSTGFRCAR